MFDASALPVFLSEAKVFPCVPLSKDPATKHGFKDASDDKSVLEEWKAVNPAFNWAVSCGASGLIVFDIDPNGMGWYEEITAREDAVGEAFRRAYKAKTPRGGIHIYFKGEGRSTASTIAPGVDTRGAGGYVLLPGSYVKDPVKGIDGGYQSMGGALGQAPADVLALIPDKKEGAVVGDVGHVAEDRDRNITWAIQLLDGYVAGGRVAIEGAGGNNTTYQVAASILDKGVSIDVTLDLMLNHWNEHCAPPWLPGDLHVIIANAARYGEETRSGAKGFADIADTFKAFESEVVEETAPRRRRFQTSRLWEARKVSKQATWLIPGFLPDIGVGLLYGRRGSFKTFAALDMAMTLASDIPGQWNCAPDSQAVVYLAGEGANSLIRVRSRIWEEKYQILNEPEFHVVASGVPRYTDKEGWDDLKSGLEEANIRPRLLVIDTVARLIAGMDENSAKDATMAMGLLEDISKTYNCFVLGIHHSGKDEGRGARGSTVFEDAADTVIQARKVGQQGTELFIKKQRDSEYDPDFGHYLGAEELESSGDKSVVLIRKEKPVEARSTASKETKISWTSRGYLIELLVKLGNEASTQNLIDEIVSEFDVDAKEVRKQLKATPGLDDLKFGEVWRIGGFDL